MACTMDFTDMWGLHFGHLAGDISLATNQGMGTFTAHKLILRAASKHFKQKITHQTKDWTFATVYCHHTIHTAIRFIYGFRLPSLTIEQYVNLLAFNDEYSVGGLDAALNAAATQIGPFQFIHACDTIPDGDHKLMNVGIGLLRDNKANVDKYIGDIRQDFSQHKRMRKMWLETKQDMFTLLRLDCCALSAAYRDHYVHVLMMPDMLVDIDFRTFTREECETAKEFPVIKDWPVMKHMLDQLHPRV
jgi:hypothetical protein